MTWTGACAAITLIAMMVAISCQPGSNTSTSGAFQQSNSGSGQTTRSETASAILPGFSFPSAPDRDHKRGDDDVTRMNRACVACHVASDSHTMHLEEVGLACTDCHGGNWDRSQVPSRLARSDPRYDECKRLTHVFPKYYPDLWKTSANPQLLSTVSLHESVDWIRFVNPGDLRAARAACATCHADEVFRVKRSMMTHGAMLWESALYNNGVVKQKNAVYAEEYTADPRNPSVAVPAKVVASSQPSEWPTASQTLYRGTLPELYPIPRWEITIPGNVLRVFERGGAIRPVIGIPETEEDPGRPDVKLSVRGYGTDVRTDPVFIGLQKTRLLDPTLAMFGTNDHPGDYRSSGCTACHVVYANDRSPVHNGRIPGVLGEIANYGNRGESFSVDPTVNPSAQDGAPTTQPYADPYDLSRPARESGHPIKHTFIRNMPTSTCIVCHVHPGTNVMNSYLGVLWWDNETDGKLMYPNHQKYPSAKQEFAVTQHNPEGAAVRGLWSDLYPQSSDHEGHVAGPDFLENLTKLNPLMQRTQLADFHGHGWVFRAVFKQDRHGNLLDFAGVPVKEPTPRNMAASVAYQWHQPGDHPPRGVPVHLKDIHLEKGMQCADCHFAQDSHGDGNLYGETRNPVMVECIDCHGTSDKPAAILRYLDQKQLLKGETGNDVLASAFTGNAATASGDRDSWMARNRGVITRHFDVDDNGRLIQKSGLDPAMQWTVVQTRDTVVPDSWWNTDRETDKSGARRARFAHTVRTDNKTWGAVPRPGDDSTKPSLPLAHADSRVSCYACHSSWNTSCFGCHLPQRANQRKQMLHNEGILTRNYTNYNYQTLRDDVYMLGVDSTVKGHKVVPIRSACAVVVSSQDANRQWIYTQQQTISAEGYAGTAFTPYFPHTVRAAETKHCEDCHISRNGDNNAIMAQLLLQGTKSVNFIGRFAWVAEGKGGLEAVAVTERDEPQAVIGSRLHKIAYPDYFRQHVARGGRLCEAHDHHGEVLDVQLRGEYVYAACGPEGFIAYDIANIDNKGFSERIITAPVSPLGQRFYVPSKYATSVCSPSTMALDPSRPRLPANEEGKITEIGDPKAVIDPSRPIHPMYGYLYVTDRDEGLIVIGNPADDKTTGPGVVTLLDGNPRNNFLQRAVTYNPGGLLDGARRMSFYGHYAYVACDRGLVVIDMDDPLHPRPMATPQLAGLRHPRKVVFQFRYGFVVDDDGLKVIRLDDPTNPLLVGGAEVPIADARDLYVSRTYGYVAAGAQGLVILDLEKPESPQFDQSYNAEGQIRDATAVRFGMTNASMFLYIADGKYGLKVLELTSPEDTPTYLGFSPPPQPRMIAWYPTRGPAVSLSEGLDRDRAVDESGNQLAVFGRRGARPFTLDEQRRLYVLHGTSDLYTVLNDPWTQPIETKVPTTAEQPKPKEESPSQPARPRFPGRR